MSHIFISYNQKDRIYAQSLAKLLRENGLAVWIDQNNIKAGDEWWAEIVRGIEECFAVIVIMSPESDNSEWVQDEITIAKKNRKNIFPLLLRGHSDTTNWNKLIRYQVTDVRDERMPDHHFINNIKHKVTPDILRSYVERLRDFAAERLEADIIAPIDISVTYLADSDSRLDMLNSSYFSDAVKFMEAFERLDKQAMLVGEAGSGKTVALLDTAHRFAKGWLDEPSIALLPIFGTVAKWNSSEHPTLADWLSAEHGIPHSDLRKIMDDGKALLLLDGIDELGEIRTEVKQGSEVRFDPRERFIDVLNKELGDNRVLITCRSDEYPSIRKIGAISGVLTIQPLLLTQIRNFLEDVPELLCEIENDEDLIKIARNPLFLSYLVVGYRDYPNKLRTLPGLTDGAVRDEIFTTYIDKRYEHEQKHLSRQGKIIPFSLDQINRFLGQLAMENSGGLYRNHEDIKSQHIDNIIQEQDIVNIVKHEYKNSWSVPESSIRVRAEEFKEFCIKLQFLQLRGDGIGFYHRLLRDTLAFRYCRNVLGESEYYHHRLSPNPASALGSTRDSRAFNPLVDLLNRTTVKRLLNQCAADGLGRLGNKEAKEHLLEVVRDKQLGPSAATALLRLGDRESIRVLIDLLDDPNLHVWKNTIDELSTLGEAAIDHLVPYIDHKSARVRKNIARIFERSQSPYALHPLLILSLDPEELVHRETQKILGELSVLYPDELLEIATESAEDIQVRKAALSRLVKSSHSIQPESFIVLLSDENSAIRELAVAALSSLRDGDVIDSLIKLLQKSNRTLRRQILNALVGFHEPSLAEMFIALTNDGDSEIRELAVNGLGYIKEAGVPEYLVQLLIDSDVNICRSAANSLQSLGIFAAESLIGSIRNQNLLIRREVVRILANIEKHDNAVEPLIAVLSDNDAIIRRYAIAALNKHSEPRDPRIVSQLIYLLRDNDEIVRRNVIEALGSHGDDRATEALLDVLYTEQGDIQHFAATALVRLGDRAAVSPLLTILHDESSQKRQEAAFALGGLGDTSAVEPLLMQLRNDNSLTVRKTVIQALGNLGDKRVVQPLIDSLNDDSLDVRISASEALGKLGDDRAREALKNKLDKEHPTFERDDIARRYVRIALRQLGVNQEGSTAQQAEKTQTDQREQLIRQLYSDNRYARREAAYSLREYPDSFSIDALASTLEDRSIEVRRVAVDSLTVIGTVEALTAVQEWQAKLGIETRSQPLINPELSASLLFDDE